MNSKRSDTSRIRRPIRKEQVGAGEAADEGIHATGLTDTGRASLAASRPTVRYPAGSCPTFAGGQLVAAEVAQLVPAVVGPVVPRRRGSPAPPRALRKALAEAVKPCSTLVKLAVGGTGIEPVASSVSGCRVGPSGSVSGPDGLRQHWCGPTGITCTALRRHRRPSTAASDR